VTLLYGNRGVNDIIFRRKIAELKDLYLGRFNVMHVLAEGDNDVELLSGMLTSEKVEELVSTFLDPTAVDGYFICGPGPMMDGADAALKRLGVAKERVKIESFGAAAPTHRGAVICDVEDDVNAAQATVIVGGSRKQVKVPRSGNVLDAALAAKMDLPFACKGGVCCTCKARLVEGEVEMAVNYGLEDDEIERGFILTCQARPLSRQVGRRLRRHLDCSSTSQCLFTDDCCKKYKTTLIRVSWFPKREISGFDFADRRSAPTRMCRVPPRG